MFPITRIRHRNAHTRKREERHELYTQQKKFKKIKNIDSQLEKTLIDLDRQFLHAKSIGFVHPRTGQELEFTSKLPKDLELVLKKLKNAYK